MADDDNQEANEDVLEAVEDLDESVSDLKEAAEDHPDETIKATLTSEIAKLEEIINAIRAAVGGS
jgi:hypothetical protein